MSELLSNILEKYVARSGPDSGEQDFVDKHTDNVNVTDAPGREGPSEGEKRKKAARSKVNQGEDDPEDEEAMYEQAEVDSVIAEYYEEASEEEREVIDQMMETEEGRAELAQWILEADENEDGDDDSEEDDEDEDEDDDDEDMNEAAADFKVGAKVKIDKPGHEWHGKTGEVLKSKTFDRTKKGIFSVGIKGTLSSNRFKSDELMLAEDVSLDEAHSKWTVELPDQKKTVTVDKARNSAEAIKKAVTQSGGKADDWKHVKVGKITKVKE